MNNVWIWGIISFILISIEMLTSTFYIFWFGVGAGIVAIILAIDATLSLPMQLFLFSITSIVSLFLFKKSKLAIKKPISNIGQSKDDTIGQQGILSEDILNGSIGEVTFSIGVMGSKTWQAIADGNITKNSKVEVIEIQGNYLKVKEIN